jgi:signal transduction histidine kinase
MEAVDLCQNRSGKAKVHIDVSCSPDLRIDCRPNQIAQILLNLISNSIDALENLSDKFIKIIVSENTDHISIHFRDSGKGIDPVIAAKIMNPFFTTKPPGKGTGMGLGISKGLAKKHGGDLVYLLPEKHTTFLLTLPKNHLN